MIYICTIFVIIKYFWDNIFALLPMHHSSFFVRVIRFVSYKMRKELRILHPTSDTHCELGNCWTNLYCQSCLELNLSPVEMQMKSCSKKSTKDVIKWQFDIHHPKERRKSVLFLKLKYCKYCITKKKDERWWKLFIRYEKWNSRNISECCEIAGSS